MFSVGVYIFLGSIIARTQNQFKKFGYSGSLLRSQTKEIGIYNIFVRCRRKLVTALNGAVQIFVSFLRHRISLCMFSKFPSKVGNLGSFVQHRKCLHLNLSLDYINHYRNNDSDQYVHTSEWKNVHVRNEETRCMNKILFCPVCSVPYSVLTQCWCLTTGGFCMGGRRSRERGNWSGATYPTKTGLLRHEVWVPFNNH